MLDAMHQRIAEDETVDPKRLKSRIIFCDKLIRGYAETSDAHMHICLKLLPGRSVERLKKLAQAINNIAKTQLDQKHHEAITTEVQIIDQATYVSG